MMNEPWMRSIVKVALRRRVQHGLKQWLKDLTPYLLTGVYLFLSWSHSSSAEAQQWQIEDVEQVELSNV